MKAKTELEQMKTIITTRMKEEAVKQIEFVISLAGRWPEHREDVSKALDALDLLLKSTPILSNENHDIALQEAVSLACTNHKKKQERLIAFIFEIAEGGGTAGVMARQKLKEWNLCL